MQLVKWNYLEDCTVFEVIHFTNLCRSASSLHMQRSCPFISDTNAHQAFTCGGARPAAPSFARNGHACPVPTHAAHPRHMWQTPSSSNTIPPASCDAQSGSASHLASPAGSGATGPTARGLSPSRECRRLPSDQRASYSPRLRRLANSSTSRHEVRPQMALTGTAFWGRQNMKPCHAQPYGGT